MLHVSPTPLQCKTCLSIQQHARMVIVACIVNASPHFPVQFPTHFLSFQCRPRLKPTRSPVYQCSLKPLTLACDSERCVGLFKLTACACRSAAGCTYQLPPQHPMPVPASSKHCVRHRQQLECNNLTADASLHSAHRLSRWKRTCLVMVGTVRTHFA